MTGYDGIRANPSTALGEYQVRAVMLDIGNHGSERLPGFLSDRVAVRAARRSKSLGKIITALAYSAAYAPAPALSRQSV